MIEQNTEHKEWLSNTSNNSSINDMHRKSIISGLYMLSVSGMLLIISYFVAESRLDPVGFFSGLLGYTLQIVATFGYLHTHSMKYPSKWYYLRPKIVIKRIVINVFGLF